jgi:hypothetical protein
MKLTDRDMEILEFCKTGATLNQLTRLFFPSYSMASQRLVKLVKARFLKETINPTVGAKVYYVTRPPSYHTIVQNDIKIALRGKYDRFKPDFKVGKTLVDFAVQIKDGKYLIFEINIFKQTTQKRVDYLREVFQRSGERADIWIVKWRPKTTRCPATRRNATQFDTPARARVQGA